MKNIKDYIGKKYAVKCNTSEEWDKITKLLNYNWVEGTWGRYGEDTCIQLASKGYSPKDFYQRNNYTILEAKDFLEDNNSLSINLKEGKWYLVKCYGFDYYIEYNGNWNSCNYIP